MRKEAKKGLKDNLIPLGKLPERTKAEGEHAFLCRFRLNGYVIMFSVFAAVMHETRFRLEEKRQLPCSAEPARHCMQPHAVSIRIRFLIPQLFTGARIAMAGIALFQAMRVTGPLGRDLDHLWRHHRWA